VIPLLALVAFSIDPPVITECVNGLGQATLQWRDAGASRVQVRRGARPDKRFDAVRASPEDLPRAWNWLRRESMDA